MDQTTQRKDKFIWIKLNKERINLFGSNYTKKEKMIWINPYKQRKIIWIKSHKLHKVRRRLDQTTQRNKKLIRIKHTGKEKLIWIKPSKG